MFIINRKRHFVYRCQKQQQQPSITTMTSQRKSGSGVVVTFNYRVGNCQRNSCAKFRKYQNNHKSYDKKSTGLFVLWTQCRTLCGSVDKCDN